MGPWLLMTVLCTTVVHPGDPPPHMYYPYPEVRGGGIINEIFQQLTPLHSSSPRTNGVLGTSINCLLHCRGIDSYMDIYTEEKLSFIHCRRLPVQIESVLFFKNSVTRKSTGIATRRRKTVTDLSRWSATGPFGREGIDGGDGGVRGCTGPRDTCRVAVRVVSDITGTLSCLKPASRGDTSTSSSTGPRPTLIYTHTHTTNQWAQLTNLHVQIKLFFSYLKWKHYHVPTCVTPY